MLSTFCKVGGSFFFIGVVVFNNPVNQLGHFPGNGYDGFFGGQSFAEILKMGLPVAISCSNGRPGDLNKGAAKIFIPFGDMLGISAICTLAIPRRQAGPTGKMIGGWKAFQSMANLCYNGTRTQFSDARNQQ